VLTGKNKKIMDFIKVDCVTGNTYSGYVLNHQRELPKNAKLYECGQEYNNKTLGRNFSIYKKIMNKGNKFYIIFNKEYF